MRIELNQLTHNYDVDVIKDLNFVLDDRHSVAIIGVSGSGKSTLIRLMSGLEKPTQGKVLMNQEDVLSPSYKKRIGFVFQNHNLFPHLSLLRNITLVLEKTRNMEPQEAQQIAMKYLNMLHLSDQIHKVPKNVSGGQAQRASIARALSVNPDIIFLDEPTSALDPILTHEVLSAIEELKGLGKDFVFVTHEMSFVRDFADYVIFMENGLIVEHGEVSILDMPQTTALQAFMKKVR